MTELYSKISDLATKNKLPHAIIFEGENAQNASNYLAQLAVCSNANKPCGVCKDCIKANKKVHPDIIELFPTGKANGYPIEEIRRIKEDAALLPNEAGKKVYIFNDVDNISVVSQNALLKILEEPPSSVIFVLNCKSKTHLLDTIISRATNFYVGEGAQAEKEDDLSSAFDFINCAVFESELELLKKTQLLTEREKRLKFIDEMQSALRVLYRIKSGVCTDETKENLVSVLTLNKIIKAIEITENMRISTLKNKSVKLTLVKFCACFKAVLGR